MARLESDAVYSALAPRSATSSTWPRRRQSIEVLGALDARRRRTIAVPKPTGVAADPVRGLLWVISNREKLLAVTPDGTGQAGLQRRRLSPGTGRPRRSLAVASYETGKVHVSTSRRTDDGLIRLAGPHDRPGRRPL